MTEDIEGGGDGIFGEGQHGRRMGEAPDMLLGMTYPEDGAVPWGIDFCAFSVPKECVATAVRRCSQGDWGYAPTSDLRSKSVKLYSFTLLAK